MSQFSRPLRRWSLLRVSAITLGAAWLLVLAAYADYAVNGNPSASSLGAAAVLALIAAASFMYAWREPAA